MRKVLLIFTVIKNYYKEFFISFYLMLEDLNIYLQFFINLMNYLSYLSSI